MYLSEWLKLKKNIVTIPKTGKDVEKLNHSYTASENKNGTASLEKQLAAS